MAPKEYSDAELLDLLRDGDHAAFTVIFQRYWKKLLHFALQKCGDAMEAENMVQEVFVSLWKRHRELPPGIELAPYLTVSVKYRVIKSFHSAHARYLSRNLEAAGDVLDDSTRQYLDLAQLQEQLDHLVHQLPEKAQLIYRLHQEQDLSHREIAEALGMNEKAVNTQLVRARKALRMGLNAFLHGFLL